MNLCFLRVGERREAIGAAGSWLMSRFAAFAPTNQGGWTKSRTPLKPAPKRLRDLLAERGNRKP